MILSEEAQIDIDDNASVLFRGEKVVVVHLQRAGDIDIVGMGAVDISLNVKLRVACEKQNNLIAIAVIVQYKFVVIIRGLIHSVNIVITTVVLAVIKSVDGFGYHFKASPEQIGLPLYFKTECQDRQCFLHKRQRKISFFPIE